MNEYTINSNKWAIAKGNLTARQMILLNYLRKLGGEYVRQRDILSDLRWEYDYHNEDPLSSGFGAHPHETTARRELTKDIKALRDTGEYAIISNGKGVTLGTVEMAAAYHKRRLLHFARYIQKEKEILKRYGIIGQIDTDGNWVEVEGND